MASQTLTMARCKNCGHTAEVEPDPKVSDTFDGEFIASCPACSTETQMGLMQPWE